MDEHRILLTGSAGLIGRSLSRCLQRSKWKVEKVDLLESDADDRFDVCDEQRMAARLQGVAGIIHLAAVSRVIHGEQNPALCQKVNYGATNGIIQLARVASKKPWMIFASSREVYGQQARLPVAETAVPLPMNAYARSKLAAEQALLSSGLAGAIVRFSNVYGDIIDHKDRVVPAFCAAAASGGTLRIDGADNGFDFTHVNDVVDGIRRVVDLLESNKTFIPPVHFVSGRRCTLGQLAELAIEVAGTDCKIVHAEPRSFDVHDFVGNPQRASALLSWRASTDLKDGIRRLVEAHSRDLGPLESRLLRERN